MKILGIDEAGRGCVIGPMAVGAVIFEEKELGFLKDLGVKDSKLLSREKREELYPQIRERAAFHKVRLVTPADIDEASLNQIDLQEIISFIAQLNPDKAIFDVPTNPAGVANFVKAVRLGLVDSSPQEKTAQGKTSGVGSAETPEVGELGGLGDTESGYSLPTLVGENKADEKYPIVSAASILAKVERDRVISELHKEYSDFGSGYMSDKRTQKFLCEWFAEHKDFPPIVRRKWSSVRKYLEKQESLF